MPLCQYLGNCSSAVSVSPHSLILPGINMRARLSPTLLCLAGAVSQSLASYRSDLRPSQNHTASVNLGYEIHTATVNVIAIPTQTCVEDEDLTSFCYASQPATTTSSATCPMPSSPPVTCGSDTLPYQPTTAPQ